MLNVSPAAFITCAITGSGDSTGTSDKVPVTPKEIAESALDAAAFDPVEGGHAYCPPATGETRDSESASIAARISASERWCRDLAVPIGIASAAATSGNGIPR